MKCFKFHVKAKQSRYVNQPTSFISDEDSTASLSMSLHDLQGATASDILYRRRRMWSSDERRRRSEKWRVDTPDEW